MRTPQLVASDLDGTLLDPAEQVTPRTAEVITRVLASGTPFVLVTGRPPRWVPRVAVLAGVGGYAVCANGAVIYDIAADRVVRTHWLDPVQLNDIGRVVLDTIPGSLLATERVGESAMADATTQFLAEPAYLHPWPNPDSAAAPRAEVLGRPAIKLLVRNPSMTSHEMMLAATAVLGDEVAITYSSNSGLLEISAPGVTKATGLAEVAELHGVSREDIVTFGDMPNDVPMLRWAGHGVAMANAHPDVKTAADEVTGSNSDDGLALVLERWF